MKKFIAGLVLGIIISAGVAHASAKLPTTVFAQPTAMVEAPEQLTPTEEIALGHTFSMYTGAKLEAESVKPQSDSEWRASVEARLSALESKIK